MTLEEVTIPFCDEFEIKTLIRKIERSSKNVLKNFAKKCQGNISVHLFVKKKRKKKKQLENSLLKFRVRKREN